MPPLFVYGTLTDPRVREQLLGRRPELTIVPARLRGYARVTVPEIAYPFVDQVADGVVDGLAILGLGDDDYAILDAYEDLDQGTYERVGVPIELTTDTVDQTVGNRAVEDRAVGAWVYARPR